MTIMLAERAKTSFKADAGIAIGPILFVIAILGILAAAIAAGSGSFTAGSQTEGNRTKAAALIEIGQNLKIGMDRITGTGNQVINAIGFVTTTNATDLYAPTGGGINVPSTAMANTPTSDVWYYPVANWAALGTNGSSVTTATGGLYNQLAVLKVSQGVCQEVNNKLYGSTGIPTAAYGDLTTIGTWSAPVTTFSSGTNLTSGTVNLAGKSTGCIYNSTATAAYYFYQVLAVQ